MKSKVLILLCMLLIFVGCSTKQIIQVDGMPISQNEMRLKIFDLNLIMKYNLMNIYDIIEDDESYEFYSYLPVISQKIQKIDKTKKLILNVNIFNPEKHQYKLITFNNVEGGKQKIEEIYYGDISRKKLSIKLPTTPNKLIRFHFKINDERGNLFFRSFDMKYIIER